jgi:hypothetical protein
VLPFDFFLLYHVFFLFLGEQAFNNNQVLLVQQQLPFGITPFYHSTRIICHPSGVPTPYSLHSPALILNCTHELLHSTTNTKIEHLSCDEAQRALRRFPHDDAQHAQESAERVGAVDRLAGEHDIVRTLFQLYAQGHPAAGKEAQAYTVRVERGRKGR